MVKKKYKKIKYEEAEDIEERMREIVKKLGMNHVRVDDVKCIRSYQSKSRGTIARCHGLGKVMQLGLKRNGFYVLEFLSERFDSLSREERDKVIIHELMHIPKSFGGGFKHHDYVSDQNVELMFEKFRRVNEFLSKFDNE